AEHKCLKRGVKKVVKCIWHDCVIAGNISPIDVITHVPILYEEADVHGKKLSVFRDSDSVFLMPWDLANAGATKRPTCCVLVLSKPTKGELGQDEQDKRNAGYTEVISAVSELTSSLF
ncbi:hypothetical protein RJ641_014795, partial [Dillenia turbinata]